MIDRQIRWRWLLLSLLILAPVMTEANFVATFDEFSLPDKSYYNGSDGAGSFASGGIEFVNSYGKYGDMEFWSGWAYSNVKDNRTAGWGNQYAAYPGGAKSGANYGVYYQHYGSSVSLVNEAPTIFRGAYFTNTTYTALIMLNGDENHFAKKFGGSTGSDPDWFLLSITGLNANGGATGTLDFYLADYRFADNRQDFIVDTWTWVDLSSLGEVASLKFDLSSSDEDPIWGMNTPAFFAMDDLVHVPEPSTLVLSCAGIAAAAAVWIVRRRRAREEAA